MKNKNILLALLIIIVLFTGFYFFKNKNNVVINTESNVSTTTNVVLESTTTTITNKPVVKSTTQTTKTYTNNSYIKIGQRILINNVYVTPTKVTYDSRCPTDVRCIQAGTVELGVLLESGNLSQNVIITLGKSVYFAERQVLLTTVNPGKLSGKTIKDSDYRFIISVK